jgi:hypothetical protein
LKNQLDGTGATHVAVYDIPALEKIRTKIGRSLVSSEINLEVVRLQINLIIEKVMEMAEEKIMSFSKYTKYLNYDFVEHILIAMKKELYDA